MGERGGTNAKINIRPARSRRAAASGRHSQGRRSVSIPHAPIGAHMRRFYLCAHLHIGTWRNLGD